MPELYKFENLLKYLEELGFNVTDNQSLGLDVTNRKLNFDLEVPLDGSLDLKDGDKLESALNETELANLGQVLGSAYVQAETGVKRQINSDLDTYDFWVVSVGTMKSILTDPKPVSTVAINSSYSVTVETNDDAEDLINKIKNVSGWAALNISISSISNDTGEHLVFKLAKGGTFSCSLGSLALAKKVECHSDELYYERLCELPFDENCVKSAYFYMDSSVTKTFAEGNEICVEMKYDGTSKAKSTFKLTQEDIANGTWKDFIVAAICDADFIQDKGIVVKIVGNQLVLSKNGVDSNEYEIDSGFALRDM